MPSEPIETKLPAPQKTPAPSKEGTPSNLGRALSSVGIVLLEVILPAALSLVIIYYLIGYINLWSLERNTALVLFGIILVAFSLGLSVAYDSVTSPIRLKRAASRKKRVAEFRLRLVRLGVGGLLLPAALVAAANLVPLPGGGTSMTYFIQATLNKPKTTPAALIGDAIINTTNPAVELQGIKTLQSIHTADSLDQLLRVLNNGTALKDASAFEALSQAIASSGVTAKPKLLEAFTTAPPETSTSTAMVDLYNLYLAAPIATLRQAVNDQNADPKSRQAALDQLDTAVNNLKNSLGTIQSQAVNASHPASLQDFILHTFLEMDLKLDVDLLAFAKTTASNTAFSDNIRGQAFLLIAKLGGKDDFTVLYNYLGNDHDSLKIKAMEAIVALEAKVSGTAPK